jgi:hypothetical protein
MRMRLGLGLADGFAGAGAPVSDAPVLSNGVASNPPAWDEADPNRQDGDTIELDFTTDGSEPDGTAEATHTLVSTDESIGWPPLGLIAGGTTVKVRTRRVRSGVPTAWSNTLTIGPIATWTPAAYFISNTSGGIPPQGMFYAPSETTCYTDTSATTLVSAIGQSVAYVKDLSGNSIDIAQNTAGNRPTYQTTTGVFGTGLPYLQFDGTNDVLASGTPSFGGPWAQPSFGGHSVKGGTTASAIQIEDGLSSSTRMGLFMNAPNWGMVNGSGAVSTLAGSTNDAIVTVLRSGTSSYIRLNGTQSANLNAGTQIDSGITIGASYVPNTWWNSRWYGGFRLYVNPSSTLRSLLETWLTGLHP